MAEGFLPPVVAELRASIADFTAKMAEARGEMAATAESGSANFERHAAIGKAALLGIAGVAVAAAVVGIKAATDEEAAHARLEVAVKNTGVAYSVYADRVSNLDQRSRALGFTDAETQNSLARLTTATHDTGKAIDLMSLSEDIARARHIDLQSATDILVKVEGGRYGLLGRMLGISKQQVESLHSEHDAVQLLTNLYGGNASKFAETFAGKLQIVKAQGEEIAASFGNLLIPVIERAGEVAVEVAGFFEQNRVAAYALGAVIGGYLAYNIGAFIAMKVGDAADAIGRGFERMSAGVVRAGEDLGILTPATEAQAAADADAAAAAVVAGDARLGEVAATGDLAAAQGVAAGAADALAEAELNVAAAEQAVVLAQYEAATSGQAEAVSEAEVAAAEQALTFTTYELIAAEEALTFAQGEVAAVSGGLALEQGALAADFAASGAAAGTAGAGMLVAGGAATVMAASALGTLYVMGAFDKQTSGVNVTLAEHHRHLRELHGELTVLAERESYVAGLQRQAADAARADGASIEFERGHMQNLSVAEQELSARHHVLNADVRQLALHNADAARTLIMEAAAAGVSHGELLRLRDITDQAVAATQRKIDKAAAHSVAESAARVQVEAAANAMQRQVVSTDLTDQALTKLIGTLGAVGNSQLAVQSATLNLQSDMMSLSSAQDAASAAGGNNAEANLRVEQAENTAMQAALSLAKAHVINAAEAAHATGASFGTAEAQYVLRASLQSVEDQFPGLKGQIDDYIAHMNFIPTNKETNVDVNTAAAAAKLGQFIGEWDGKHIAINIDAYGPYGTPGLAAEGGIFTRPTFGIFGEAGAEAIIPLTKPDRAWEILMQTGLLHRVEGQGSAVGTIASTPTSTSTSTTTIVVVQSFDEAMEYIPPAARSEAREKFLSGRRRP